MNHRALFVLLFVQTVFGQRFVAVDDETLEFIPDVNYHLYAGKKNILTKTCENDNATIIPGTVYDSIVFEKFGYRSRTVLKDSVKAEQIVFLIPQVFALDEMVLTRNKKDTLLGEKGKFFRRRNHPMLDHLVYALWIENPYRKEVRPTAFQFSVEKVKYKTAYRILFYPYRPTGSHLGYYDPGEALFASRTAYLMPGEKGLIILDLTPGEFTMPENGVLASFELIGYFDANDQTLVPAEDDRTMVKFQFSKQANYFSRTVDLYTREESKGLINLNAMINYDFAFHFFKKPHKSNLIAPAFFLEVAK